jgi:hypothetical protein
MKIFIFIFVSAYLCLASSGCGRQEMPAAQGEDYHTVGVRKAESSLPEGILPYPGADAFKYPDEYTVIGEGVKYCAFETSDGLMDVYKFYKGKLNENGLDVSGDIVLGAGFYFVLEVKRNGADYAIIRAVEEAGKTRFVIWHSIGG